MGDASTRELPRDIRLAELKALFTRAGSELVDWSRLRVGRKIK
jgi:hypothetical protein